MDTKAFQEILERFEWITPLQQSKLLHYGSLLQEKNQLVNLISRKDIDNIYKHHILHSLSILYFLRFHPNQTVLDIGSGGGIPGIPLAIIFPKTNFILTDRIGKKVTALEDFKRSLSLDNIITKKADVAKLHLTVKVDTVMARAVASLNLLVQYAKHLLSAERKYTTSGYLFLKGGDLQKEMQNCSLQFKVYSIHEQIASVSYYQEKYLLHAK